MRDAALIRKRSLLGRLGQFRSRKCLPAVLHDEYSFDIYGWVTASSGEVQASQRFGGGRLTGSEVELFSRPHLGPEGAGSDQKNKLLDASSESEIPSEGVWSQPWDNGHLVSCLRFAR